MKPPGYIADVGTIYTWVEVPHLRNSSVRCLNVGPEDRVCNDTVVPLNLTMASQICQSGRNSDP